MDSLKKRREEPEPTKTAYSPCWNASNNGLLSHLRYENENQICTVPLHPDCGKNTAVPCKCHRAGYRYRSGASGLHTYSSGSRVVLHLAGGISAISGYSIHAPESI